MKKDTPAAHHVERTSDDHDPSCKRALCGNRCRQERFGDSRHDGSGRQRSGDSDSMVRNNGSRIGGVARVATPGKGYVGCDGEHGFVLDSD